MGGERGQGSKEKTCLTRFKSTAGDMARRRKKEELSQFRCVPQEETTKVEFLTSLRGERTK